MTDTTTRLDPFTACAPGERLAAYRRLSAAPGVRKIATPDGQCAWLVTDYVQVRALFGDPRLTKVLSPTSASADRLLPEIASALTRHMLTVDGSEHARLRRLVSKVFTPRMVERLEPRIQQIADDLLDGLERAATAGEVIDLLAVYAFPLPMTVICELVGVPEGDRENFRRWTNVMVGASFADADAFRVAATALVGYVRELIEIRRAHPADDLLSALVAARDGGDKLSEDELTSMVWVLVLAGHETTVNLIANGVYELLTHPDQLARLRGRPELMETCVEELLRVASPVHTAVPMAANEAIEINGVRIEAGEMVLPSLMAANHDPCRLSGADTLDIGREDNPHMAFGYGMHYCLGAPLARLEGRIALASLLDRFPDLALAVPPETITWRPSYILHGPTALPIRLAPDQADQYQAGG